MKIIIKLILIVLLVSCNSSLEKWKSYDESKEIFKIHLMKIKNLDIKEFNQFQQIKTN